MKNFEEYVTSWWHDYLEEHDDDGGPFYNEAFNEVVDREENDTLDDYLDEHETELDWLLRMDAEEIYNRFFGYGDKQTDLPDIPDTESFLYDMFMQAVDNDDKSRTYTQEFVRDMASSAENYSDASGFFSDLSRGGCQSGMVGMLIYHDDCKRIYIENIDDMEDFRSAFEDELGEAIRDKSGLPHYTFMCWLCYEELAYHIARNLFPEHF